MRVVLLTILVLLGGCHRRMVYLHLDADQAPTDTVWRVATVETAREVLGGRRFDATALQCGAGEKLLAIEVCEGRSRVCAERARGPDGADHPKVGTVAGLRVIYACGPERDTSTPGEVNL